MSVTVQVSMQVSTLNFKEHSFGKKKDQLCVETGQINKKIPILCPVSQK